MPPLTDGIPKHCGRTGHGECRLNRRRSILCQWQVQISCHVRGIFSHDPNRKWRKELQQLRGGAGLTVSCQNDREAAAYGIIIPTWCWRVFACRIAVEERVVQHMKRDALLCPGPSPISQPRNPPPNPMETSGAAHWLSVAALLLCYASGMLLIAIGDRLREFDYP